MHIAIFQIYIYQSFYHDSIFKKIPLHVNILIKLGHEIEKFRPLCTKDNYSKVTSKVGLCKEFHKALIQHM